MWRHRLDLLSPDLLDWNALARGHRHTATAPWMAIAKGRLPGAQAFCLRTGAEIRLAMNGRMVPEPTGNPWLDPHPAQPAADPDPRYPCLAFLYPNYDAFPVGPDAGDRDHLEDFVHAVTDHAREAGARTVAFQYLGPECGPLADVLSQHGFEAVPAGRRAELLVQWTGLQGYLHMFPKRRRDKLKHEIRALAAEEVTTRVRALSDDEATAVRLRCSLMEKYGARADQARERSWFDRVRECFPAEDIFVVEAAHHTTAIAFTLFVRTGDVLTALLTGADYGDPRSRYVYFATSFYLPVQLAPELGVRTIEYGLGSERAKQSRGCRLVPLHHAVRHIAEDTTD